MLQVSDLRLIKCRHLWKPWVWFGRSTTVLCGCEKWNKAAAHHQQKQKHGRVSPKEWLVLQVLYLPDCSPLSYKGFMTSGDPTVAAMPGVGNGAFHHLCCSTSLSFAPSGPGRRGPFALPKEPGSLLLGRAGDCKMQAFLYSAQSHLSLQVEMDSFEWITISYCRSSAV